MIDVMVVEDSAVVREFIVAILAAEPGMRVVATARDGQEALAALQKHTPHVITMDIHMPRLDGLEATRQIMATRPTPIVIVSGTTSIHDVETTFDAMEAGALAVLPRPAGLGHPDHEAAARDLVRTVRLMSEVKVVRRWLPRRPAPPLPAEVQPIPEPRDIGVVAIGASTGGPPVLQTLLAGLPRDFAAPVLVVQHMASGFMPGFIEWLAHSSALPLHLAEHGQRIKPGHVYLAPDDHHLVLRNGTTLVLTRDPPEHGVRPSVSALFRSLADSRSPGCIAGLLSGMGSDGCLELLQLRQRGAVTFVQDKESSVVHGMPGEALRLDAATLVLTPARMAPALARLVRGNARNGSARP